MRVKWFGEELKKKMNEAVPLAINSILADCVRESKAVVPVKTSILQGSIQMRVATKGKDGWSGLWGSWDVLYAIFVELGTQFMRGRSYLRSVADRLYPQLADRIRQAMARLK